MIVTPHAQRHIAFASDWWRENRPAAPTLLWEEVERAYDFIIEQPYAAPVTRDLDLVGVRRLTLRRTRYYLYYRVSQDDTAVEVLAVWHTSRRQRPDL